MIQTNGRNLAHRAVRAAAVLLALVAPVGTAGPVMAQEGAAAVQDTTLQDVALTLGDTRIVVPLLTVSGTRLSREDLRAILQGAGPEPWAARLARLDAGSLVAPELRVERTEGSARQITTYRDVNAKGLRAGQVAEITVSGASLSTPGNATQAAGTGSYGKIRVTEADLAALARLYAEPGDGKAPLQRLYAAFSIEAIVFGDGDTTVRIDALSGRDLAGRQIPGGWGGAVQALGALDAAEPAQRATLAGITAEAIEGVSVGGLEATGLSVRVLEDEPAELGIGRIVYAGGDRRKLTLSDIGFAAAGTRSQLASLAFEGFSLEPTVAALRRLAADPDRGDPDLRRLAPGPGTVALSGLSLVLPREADPAVKPPAKAQPGEKRQAADPLADAARPPPLNLRLRDASVRVGASGDGLPVEGRIDLGGMTFPASLVADVPVLGALGLYGYRDLELDLVADTAWNAAGKELALREVTLSGKDMGSLRVSGTLGGIGPEVFDRDAAVSGFAMLSATAKTLDLTVRNGGLFERFIDATAKSLSLKPDELRREYETASLIGIPVILGNSTAAKTIGAAMGKFVSKPDRLTISATAKNGVGLGVVDFSTAATPASILDKLDVNAKAE